jgi:hypothetical protein
MGWFEPRKPSIAGRLGGRLFLGLLKELDEAADIWVAHHHHASASASHGDDAV